MFKLKAKLTQTYESSPSPGWPFQASVPLPEEAHSPGLPLHHSDPRLRGGGLLSSQWAALVTWGLRRTAHLLIQMADGPQLTTI